MQLEVTNVEQKIDLRTKEAKNFLRLKLPNDEELLVPVTEDDLRRVLTANEEFIAAKPESNGHAESKPQIVNAAEMLDWSLISDDNLPVLVKQQFRLRGYPQMMSMADIVRLAHEILNTSSITEMPPQQAPEAPPTQVDDDTGVPSI
jgi:hypothetical protein